MFYPFPHFSSKSFAIESGFSLVFEPSPRSDFFYCSTLSSYLLSRPSFAFIFWFHCSHCVARHFCCCFFFFFLRGLILFTWVPGGLIFLSAIYFWVYPLFSSKFCIFSTDFFRGGLFYHYLVLLLHRLTRSIRWCRHLGDISIIYLLFQSQVRNFSSLDSVGNVVFYSLITFLFCLQYFYLLVLSLILLHWDLW